MRLLDTLAGQYVEKDPRTTTYTILSHTWDDTKQTHQEVLKVQESYGSDAPMVDYAPFSRVSIVRYATFPV